MVRRLMNSNGKVRAEIEPSGQAGLAAAARTAAGHVVVAAVFEQLALGAYIIPNRCGYLLAILYFSNLVDA